MHVFYHNYIYHIYMCIYIYIVSHSYIDHLQIYSILTYIIYIYSTILIYTKYMYISLIVVSSLSHVQLFAAPWTVAHQAPLSMGFPRQEHWSGLPCPSPGHLPDPEMKPPSPARQADSSPLSHQESPICVCVCADVLQRGQAAHSSVLAWRVPWTLYSLWGCKESDTTEWPSLYLYMHTHIHSPILACVTCVYAPPPSHTPLHTHSHSPHTGGTYFALLLVLPPGLGQLLFQLQQHVL